MHDINVCYDSTMMCTLRYIHYHVGINDCDVDDSCMMLVHRTLRDHVPVHSFMTCFVQSYGLCDHAYRAMMVRPCVPCHEVVHASVYHNVDVFAIVVDLYRTSVYASFSYVDGVHVRRW